MKVDIEELGACKRRLQVEETPEVVTQAWEQAFGRVQREAKLPGFRKGKVPRSMIKLHFADDVRQEVARRLIPDVYRQALAVTRIEPVEEPDLQEVTLEENAALKFAAVVEVKPAITLESYTGLVIEHAPKPFAESEVDEALTALQEQHAEYRAVERAADPGDLVIVDYTLTPEGMEPRSETGYGFVIGTGGVLPEMEEAVIGLAAGGSRQTRVRFADDHRNEALRGKSAEASVTVSEVKEKVLPALDDDFAKSVGGNFETLDALRDEVRKGLQARREADNRRALESAVLDAVLAGHAFEVPDALVLREKFITRLTLIVSALDEPELLVPLLASIGTRHQEAGMGERHYVLMGEALLSALRTVLGTEWNSALYLAWADTYTFLSSIMKRAGARASGAHQVVVE